MRDKDYFNDRLSPTFVNKDMKDFVKEMSDTKNNKKKSIGQHHVVDEALRLLYRKKKGHKFSLSKTTGQTQ